MRAMRHRRMTLGRSASRAAHASNVTTHIQAILILVAGCAICIAQQRRVEVVKSPTCKYSYYMDAVPGTFEQDECHVNADTLESMNNTWRQSLFSETAVLETCVVSLPPDSRNVTIYCCDLAVDVDDDDKCDSSLERHENRWYKELPNATLKYDILPERYRGNFSFDMSFAAKPCHSLWCNVPSAVDPYQRACSLNMEFDRMAPDASGLYTCVVNTTTRAGSDDGFLAQPFLVRQAPSPCQLVAEGEVECRMAGDVVLDDARTGATIGELLSTPLVFGEVTASRGAPVCLQCNSTPGTSPCHWAYSGVGTSHRGVPAHALFSSRPDLHVDALPGVHVCGDSRQYLVVDELTESTVGFYTCMPSKNMRSLSVTMQAARVTLKTSSNWNELTIASTAVSGTLLLVALVAIVTLISCYRSSAPAQADRERARSPTPEPDVRPVPIDENRTGSESDNASRSGYESDNEPLLRLGGSPTVTSRLSASDSTLPSLSTRPTGLKTTSPVLPHTGSLPSSTVIITSSSADVTVTDGGVASHTASAVLTVAGALSPSRDSPDNSMLVTLTRAHEAHRGHQQQHDDMSGVDGDRTPPPAAAPPAAAAAAATPASPIPPLSPSVAIPVEPTTGQNASNEDVVKLAEYLNSGAHGGDSICPPFISSSLPERFASSTSSSPIGFRSDRNDTPNAVEADDAGHGGELVAAAAVAGIVTAQSTQSYPGTESQSYPGTAAESQVLLQQHHRGRSPRSVAASPSIQQPRAKPSQQRVQKRKVSSGRRAPSWSGSDSSSDPRAHSPQQFPAASRTRQSRSRYGLRSAEIVTGMPARPVSALAGAITNFGELEDIFSDGSAEHSGIHDHPSLMTSIVNSNGSGTSMAHPNQRGFNRQLSATNNDPPPQQQQQHQRSFMDFLRGTSSRQAGYEIARSRNREFHDRPQSAPPGDYDDENDPGHDDPGGTHPQRGWGQQQHQHNQHDEERASLLSVQAEPGEPPLQGTVTETSTTGRARTGTAGSTDLSRDQTPDNDFTQRFE